jgi:hypothetical protein
MATHFNAPRRIRSFASSSQEQWKLEVKKMFNTELALQQFHVLGITQGAGSSLPHARNLLKDFDVDARAKVLFPAPGWENIKVADLMGFLCACLVCWVVTIECKDGLKGKTLLMLVVGRSVWTCCAAIVRSLGRRLYEARRKLNVEPMCAWMEEKLGLIGL